ncbi:TatD family deoxyribonuclease [Aliikangiella marina]|uniref:TatD family deoxyribonuclease n=1 Tax=Aliikangiella marina TaxID=1712262 RepID=A0A545T2L6_9GAMM|nr:TatD family hydrolase [Aliikangiella marina]TQV71460.1 TatD family deoxyribonuclease [Aliikangiella marina]
MISSHRLFDSHCHIDFPEFESKLDTFLAKAESAGIEGILIPGVKREGWRRIRQITARSAICHTALGLHPMFLEEHEEKHLHDLEMALSVGPISAIGEIGLDFYEADSNRSEQLKYFRAQIALAKDAKLPLVLHVRKAHDEVLSELRKINFAEGGIVHAYSGSENQAERYIDLGFKLGFGGAMTFTRALKIRRLAASLPLESIVLETDAPDMPPATCKAPFNTPLHLFDNFTCLVELREESASEIAKQTTENVYSVLNID